MKVLLTLACIVVGTAVQAAQPYVVQRPNPLSEPWRWRVFDELKGKGLAALTQAADGSMWFGVDAGVLRYDGDTWVEFTPADGLLGTPVEHILGTRDGAVYAGSRRGVSRYRDGIWERVHPVTGDVPWPVNGLHQGPDGAVWAATDWGALRILDGSTTLFTSRQVDESLTVIAPQSQVEVVTIPAIQLPWGEGLGVAVVRGDLAPGLGRVPRTVWRLAPGGPGELAGLQVGDRIVDFDGEGSTDVIDGPAGTSVRLSVRRVDVADTLRLEANPASGRRQLPATARVGGPGAGRWHAVDRAGLGTAAAGNPGRLRLDVAHPRRRRRTATRQVAAVAADGRRRRVGCVR